MTNTRMSPEQKCAMCNSTGQGLHYFTPLILQQKIGDSPWRDAVMNKDTKRWQIDAAATLLRWLCHHCHQTDKGFVDPKQRYKPYRAPRRYR